MKKFIALFISVCLSLSLAACAGGTESDSADGGASSSGFSDGDSGSNGGGTLTGSTEQTDFTTGFLRNTASDDYGRSFAGTEQCNDNLVGIFYFLWLSQAANDVTIDSYIANGNVEAALTGNEIAYSPTFTWWGEPMYGFYQVEDEWVVRKHVELFINAGLDFICFDTTNNDYYQAAAKTVLDVLLEYADLGYNVPKVMFMTNSDSSGMITSIYNAFYRRNTYDSVWFTGNGSKPWIIGQYTGGNATIEDRFYFKAAQWPTYSQNASSFPWISWRYPQETFTDAANDYSIMSVSVAQHTGIGGGRSDVNRSGVNFSLSALFAPYNYDTLSDTLKNLVSEEQAAVYYNSNWGRGYSHATGVNNYDDAVKNVNFEEQWDSAKNGDINLVFVTGWNEWIAQKQSKDPALGADYGYYCDLFSMEFSRDVEMMSGGYLDNCFIQLVRNIREYKGVGSVSNDQSAVSDGFDPYDLSAWQNVVAYADLVYETLPRNHAGAGQNYYTNDTGRNDIKEVRVATTSDSLYFLVSTLDDITEKEADDTRWMNLWIGIEGSEEDGWHGLQYVINRSLNGKTASVDKIVGDGFSGVGSCEVTVRGGYMLVKVAKSTLGIGNGGFGIQFKVTDNLQSDFDIVDLYTNGDCAPIGRINYSYYAK